MAFFVPVCYAEMIMDPKLLDQEDLKPDDLPGEDEKSGIKYPELGGRVITLPEGLKLDDLRDLTSAQIDAKIKEQGAGIGYAAIIALAAGKGGTPPGTQLRAAEFLVDRGSELEREGGADGDLPGRLRALPRKELVELIQVIEQKALEGAVNGQSVIDVVPVDDASS